MIRFDARGQVHETLDVKELIKKFDPKHIQPFSMHANKSTFRNDNVYYNKREMYKLLDAGLILSFTNTNGDDITKEVLERLAAGTKYGNSIKPEEAKRIRDTRGYKYFIY